LSRGLDAFIEDHGPFDCVIATEHVIFYHLIDSDELLKAYRRNYVCRFPIDLVLGQESIRRIFLNSTGLKLITLLESDFYNFDGSRIQAIAECDANLVTWGLEFMRSVDTLPELRNESFGSSANDNWLNFLESNATRVVSFPAFVGESEFSWRPLAERPHAWCVPGANYLSRQKVRTELAAAGNNWQGRWVNWAHSCANRVRFNPYNKSMSLLLLNYLHRKQIESSRYTYTCGSALKYPLRKFFEIPALGSLLVCDPCVGFEALGFVDRVNAMICKPEDVIELKQELAAEPRKTQNVAAAGRELVARTHSSIARIDQLSNCLAAIVGGRFRGSRWQDGEFKLLSNKT
jgi:hypothetical protein